MLKHRATIDTRYDADGTPWVTVDIQVSTADDLPELGDDIGIGKVDEGSTAQAVQEGKFYTLDADEGWYDDDGNEPEDS